MKPFFILSLLLAALNVFAGVKIIAVDSRSEGAENTLYVSDNALRVDSPGEQMSMIFDSQTEVLKHIDHSRKNYMKLDKASMEQLSATVGAAMTQVQSALANMPPEQRKMMEKMMGGMGVSANTAPAPEPFRLVKKTKEKQTINGYPCVKYNVLLDGQLMSVLWVTPYAKLGVTKSDLRGLHALTGFQDTLAKAFSSQPGLAQKIKSGVVSYDELDGLPIKMITYEDGSVTGETTIQSVEKTKLNDQLFQVPAGYQQRSMPQMPKGGF